MYNINVRVSATRVNFGLEILDFFLCEEFIISYSGED